MRHMFTGENLGLCTTRSIEIGRGWEHVLCTRNLIQHHTVSLKEVNYLFPLYLYPKDADEIDDLEELVMREEADRYGNGRRANLAPGFTAELAKRVKLTYIGDGTGDLKKTVGPEDIFHYIYAVFHSPAYRDRYAAFLKIDFPRVPLTSKRALFVKLCGLGRRLTALHLLDGVADGGVTFPVEGDNAVKAPRYVDMQQRVYINDAQYFEGIPPEVWEFHIGGYQVCHKWLKDRRKRSLSYDDIAHYLRIVSALGESIGLMGEIDVSIDAHGGWPIV